MSAVLPRLLSRKLTSTCTPSGRSARTSRKGSMLFARAYRTSFSPWVRAVLFCKSSGAASSDSGSTPKVTRRAGVNEPSGSWRFTPPGLNARLLEVGR
eukprot:CAMPEP_0180405986 /NCGR_PEP_ID=MMETSP0989-20121125/40920_1 /TAXON_ID=697907 /ORGANISM="non described non described, Strain CCMP2293" /LENGTH=97 /DNA_ID=CAMNT_0022409663 /DNA_START=101 /DNA_END=394 /DNA_ORIENTATION=-